jgi:integrase
LHYFGPWADPQAALQKYLDQKEDLHAGRTPATPGDGLIVRDLCNSFLTSKQGLLDIGELSRLTFRDYHLACGQIVKAFGRRRLVSDLRPADFERLRIRLAKRCGPVRLGNEIQQIRSVFRYAYEQELIDKPVRYGQSFKRPNRKTLRLTRNANGPRMFEADEIKVMLAAAGVPLRAMILLGINCGFGNTDCAMLPQRALDLDGGWINFPRPKTGINRRCPLWPETTMALRQALDQRPAPKDEADAGLVFITVHGRPWAAKKGVDSAISKETRKLLNASQVNGRRNFYALRHTLETIGGEARDQVAVDAIMGHAREDMASAYRERISDERLRDVVEHVRRWLFPQAPVD